MFHSHHSNNSLLAPTMDLMIFLIASLATLLLIFLLPMLLRCSNPNLPPGPKPWPIVGNLHLIGPLPHHSLHKLSQKYGPLMQLRVGFHPVIVASSVDMARAILKTHDLNFSNRPKTAAGKYTGYDHKNIAWTPYEPYWRQCRKICLTELLSAKRIESSEFIRVQETNNLLKDLMESRGKPIVLRDHLCGLTLNMISRMVLGKKYTEKSEENSIISPEEFRKMIKEWFFLNGPLNIGDSIPWIEFLDLQGYIKRMKVLSKKFDKFLEHVLDDHNERRRSADGYVAKDMVDVLLEHSADPHHEIKIERDGVKAFTLDMLLGGTESAAITMEWALSEILKNPEIYSKAIDELDKGIGKERWVKEKDIINLAYIDAIIKETMRLHPVATLLPPRQAREDCKISGYDIPKGTRAILNIYYIQRDPNLWDNPNDFCPERFIGKKIDVMGLDFEFLPFGSGRRMCPGYGLGLKVIQLSLANLLHGFTWKLANGMKKEDLEMEEIFGLTTPRKIPLIAVVEPRLPLHLYSL